MKQMFYCATALLLLSTIIAPLSTASAQNTVFTYQGLVTDNGTNFTGAGQFKFALVTSTNANQTATATAVDSSGYITSYNVIVGGSGYITAPAVTVSGGGGSGATAIVHISGGVVTSISVNTPGSSYNTTPTVIIAPPPANLFYATYWSNDGTSSAGSQPTAAVSVGVTNGLFIVVLGDTTLANMTAIATTLFTRPNLQLQIWFNDGVNGFAALSPVQNLTPAPYAIQAMNANSANSLLGTLPPSQLGGPLTLAQLPGAVVTNNAIGVNLTGTFTGNGSGLNNTITTANFVFAQNDFTSLTVITANKFQAVTFDTMQSSGWTYSSITTNFTCNQTGTYLVQYNAIVACIDNIGTSISLRALAAYQGVTNEITGSQSSVILPATQPTESVSKSFLITFQAGETLQIQFTGSSTTAELVGGNGAGNYKPCITMTIIRIQ
jgi:hypothetical protein